MIKYFELDLMRAMEGQFPLSSPKQHAAVRVNDGRMQIVLPAHDGGLRPVHLEGIMPEAVVVPMDDSIKLLNKTAISLAPKIQMNFWNFSNNADNCFFA